MVRRLVVAVAMSVGVIASTSGLGVDLAHAEGVQWEWIGPAGPFPVQSIGISPDWPADPWLEITRADGDFRSDDGGATWARVSARTPVTTVPPIAAAPGTRLPAGITLTADQPYEGTMQFDSPSIDA